MDITEIKKKYQNEIDLLGSHKDEIIKISIEPHKQTYEDIDEKVYELWAVAKKDEYFIVYNEKDNVYGLAFKNIINEFVYLGNDGSLADAYENLISRENEFESHTNQKRGHENRRSKFKRKKPVKKN